MADYKSTHTGEQIDTAIDNANSNWSTLMANLGIGRWANQTFVSTGTWGTSGEFYDSLSEEYTNLSRYLAYSKFAYSENMILKQDYNTKNAWNATNSMFFGLQSTGTLELRNINFSNMTWTFGYAQVKKIKVADGCSAIASGNTIQAVFYGCSNLEEIDGLDFGGAHSQAYVGNWFNGCVKLKRINIKHIAKSFNISISTAFEEADLVEIISNLDTVTTTQTLTMGATNLAKLTDDEKKVATDKGWVLA